PCEPAPVKGPLFSYFLLCFQPCQLDSGASRLLLAAGLRPIEENAQPLPCEPAPVKGLCIFFCMA
ncbi:MAG TPA: hypothetical protein H9723_03135, partial [Candidatus Mediterraneibacter stercoravium]|nr:hypothetical protein [Candidatus Mediterraneibacter stercoravium]